MSEQSPSPRPWSLYRTGDKLGIKSKDGKFVLRKVVSSLSIPEYETLLADFNEIIRAVNTTAELQAAKQDSELLKHAEAMAVAAEAIEELEVSLMDDVGVFKYEAALEALSSATKAYRAAIKADQAGRA